MLSFYVNMGIKCLHHLYDTRFTAACSNYFNQNYRVSYLIFKLCCVFRQSVQILLLKSSSHTSKTYKKSKPKAMFVFTIPKYVAGPFDLTKEIWVLMFCAFWNLSVYGQPLPLKYMTSSCLALAVQRF